jgi:hypothetical protein
MANADHYTLFFVSWLTVLLGINPSAGSKVARCRGKKVQSGVHDAVLSFVRELALFTDLDS